MANETRTDIEAQAAGLLDSDEPSLFDVTKVAEKLAAFEDDDAWQLVMQLWDLCADDDFYAEDIVSELVGNGHPDAVWRHLGPIVDRWREEPDMAETIVFHLGDQGSSGTEVASDWWPLLWEMFETKPNSTLDFELMAALQVVPHPDKLGNLRAQAEKGPLPHPLKVALEALESGPPDADALRQMVTSQRDWDLVSVVETAVELDTNLADELVEALADAPERAAVAIADATVYGALPDHDADVKAQLDEVLEGLRKVESDTLDAAITESGATWHVDEDPAGVRALIDFLAARGTADSLAGLRTWADSWEDRDPFGYGEKLQKHLKSTIRGLDR